MKKIIILLLLPAILSNAAWCRTELNNTPMPERNTTSSFNIDEKLKYEIDLAKTDSEFIDLFYNFALGEVVEQTSAKLDDRTRLMCNLSILLGCQGTDEFRALLPVALRCGLTPTEIKEIIYQAVAYLGMGRVR